MLKIGTSFGSSDRLRLQSGGFANLALNNTIWTPKCFDDHRNFDYSSPTSSSGFAVAPKSKASDFNQFNDGWRTDLGLSGGAFNEKEPTSPVPVANCPVDKNLSVVNGFFTRLLNTKKHFC